VIADRTFPDEKKAKHHEWHIDHRVAEEENVQNPSGIIAKGMEEGDQGGMLSLQPLDLVTLERKKRRLQPGEKCRAGSQNNDRAEEKRKLDCGHAYPPPRALQPSHGKRKRAGLPVISANTKLSFS
jgi:hypothetical protein